VRLVEEVWFASVILAGPEQAGMAEECLAADASAIIIREYLQDGRWEVLLQYGMEPSQSELEFKLSEICGLGEYSLSVNKDPETDWVSLYRRNTKPITAGCFFVYPSHFKGPVPSDKLAICLDAGLAFGTGGHATTIGCLRQLELLEASGYIPRRAIDLGSGSGILAIAMKKLWPNLSILATDIDPVAVETAKANMTENGVGKGVEFLTLDGWPDQSGFDLCTANILYAPLMKLSPKAKFVISLDGWAVLSGILNSQVDPLTHAWQASGFEMRDRLDIGGWSAIRLVRSK
jgi:ribosomal protein L11 methyltransferase